MALQKTSGIHHITATSSTADENLDFYERVLGLRLVKQTVNFDDRSPITFITAMQTERPEPFSHFSHGNACRVDAPVPE